MKSRDVIAAFQQLQREKLSANGQKALQIMGQFIPKALDYEASRMDVYTKLYARAFTSFCLHYNQAPEDSDIPQQELHRIIAQSMDSCMEHCSQELNAIRSEKHIERHGSVIPQSKLYTMQETKDNLRAQAAKALLEYREK